MAQKAQHILPGQVAFEGPGGIGVTKHIGEIGYAIEHHAFVAEALGHLKGHAIDGNLHTAKTQQIEPGGSDDDIGLQEITALQAYALGFNHFNRIGHHARAALADGAK